MDAIMKILEQLEQSQLQSPERLIPEKLRQPEVEAAPAVTQAPAEAPAPEPEPVQPGTRWTRQRILDALQLTVALGPPPGLEGL